MYVYKIKQLIKSRKFIPIYTNNIGSIIKHYRKENNLTLEEASDKICSISYLSKLENNMINANDKYIEPILTRLGLTINDYEEMVNPDNYEEVVKEWLNNNLLKIIGLEEGVELKVKINNYLYFVSNNLITESTKLFDDLINFGKTMQPEELQIFIFATAYLLYTKGRYSDSFTLLKKIELNNTPLVKEFNLLVKLYLLICAFHLNLHSYVNINYRNFVKKLLVIHRFDLIKRVEFTYMRYLILNNLPNEEAIELIDNKNLDKDKNDFLKALLYYRDLDFSKAWKTLGSIKIENENIYLLKVIVSDKLNIIDHKLLLEKPRKVLNKSYQLILEYYHMKTYFPKRTIQFLRESLLHGKTLPQSAAVINYWYNESVQYFINKSFYKAASTIMQRLKRQLNTISGH